MNGWERLSARQRQIADWVAEGLGSKQIARIAALSPLTVRTHRRSIFTLLNVHSVAELARQRRAMRTSIPHPSDSPQQPAGTLLSGGNQVAIEEIIMASETIVVQIDQGQLAAQKNNNYSLYLAKMVNGVYTVIWQSMGPVATVNEPSYESSNTFNIAIPAYQINFTNQPIAQGSVTFTSSGSPVTMNLGQSVDLDANGLFDTPTNSGTAGELTVQNSLQGNPHEILCDANGNPIFVNVASGMDIGPAVLTPIDEYQVWFGNQQETGTIIATNVSNPGTITFTGGTDNMTISYTSSGTWQNGALGGDNAALASAVKSSDIAVTVIAVFSQALVLGSITYLASKLMDKFAGNLQPTNITVSATSLSVTFAGGNGTAEAAGNVGIYDAAVNRALNLALDDPDSDLFGESWTFASQVLEVSR